MFKLNRLSCRLAFLLFCVFPTGLILAWVFFPTPTSTWEESLSNELGLEISIQQVSRPRPGTTILHGIELADLEVGSIAKLRIAEVVVTGNRRVVLVSQPEIDTDQLGHLLNKIDNRLLRQNGQCESRLRLISPKLTIHPLHPDQDAVRASETFVDVKCDIDVG
ncbi:MAG: hypothetical protein IH991_22985, partial [Planctomycetes bacterium]|nr:hypothetical protein [Planctomycetota bacterium]